MSSPSRRQLLALAPPSSGGPLLARRLAAGNASTLLSVRLLLRPATGYTAPQAAAVINANLAAIAAAVQGYLASLGSRAVSFLSGDPASAAAPLPPIAGTGPAPLQNGAAATASTPAAQAPVGLIVGVVLGVAAAVAIAAGVAWYACRPGKRRKPLGGAAGPLSSFPPPPQQQDTVLNPVVGALAIRAMGGPQSAAMGGPPSAVPPPPPPPRAAAPMLAPPPPPRDASLAPPLPLLLPPHPEFYDVSGMPLPRPEDATVSRGVLVAGAHV